MQAETYYSNYTTSEHDLTFNMLGLSIKGKPVQSHPLHSLSYKTIERITLPCRLSDSRSGKKEVLNQIEHAIVNHNKWLLQALKRF